MTDRELLEAAAKAAGLRAKWEPFSDGERLRASPDGNWWPTWNPLESDGDALRLAVKLRIHFETTEGHSWASTERVDAIEPFGADPYAATRRAIVRAAAAIGWAR